MARKSMQIWFSSTVKQRSDPLKAVSRCKNNLMDFAFWVLLGFPWDVDSTAKAALRGLRCKARLPKLEFIHKGTNIYSYFCQNLCTNPECICWWGREVSQGSSTWNYINTLSLPTRIKAWGQRSILHLILLSRLDLIVSICYQLCSFSSSGSRHTQKPSPAIPAVSKALKHQFSGQHQWILGCQRAASMKVNKNIQPVKTLPH